MLTLQDVLGKSFQFKITDAAAASDKPKQCLGSV